MDARFDVVQDVPEEGGGAVLPATDLSSAKFKDLCDWHMFDAAAVSIWDEPMGLKPVCPAQPSSHEEAETLPFGT